MTADLVDGSHLSGKVTRLRPVPLRRGVGERAAVMNYRLPALPPPCEVTKPGFTNRQNQARTLNIVVESGVIEADALVMARKAGKRMAIAVAQRGLSDLSATMKSAAAEICERLGASTKDVLEFVDSKTSFSLGVSEGDSFHSDSPVHLISTDPTFVELPTFFHPLAYEALLVLQRLIQLVCAFNVSNDFFCEFEPACEADAHAWLDYLDQYEDTVHGEAVAEGVRLPAGLEEALGYEGVEQAQFAATLYLENAEYERVLTDYGLMNWRTWRDDLSAVEALLGTLDKRTCEHRALPVIASGIRELLGRADLEATLGAPESGFEHDEGYPAEYSWGVGVLGSAMHQNQHDALQHYYEMGVESLAAVPATREGLETLKTVYLNVVTASAIADAFAELRQSARMDT